jgi:hypothetical protein
MKRFHIVPETGDPVLCSAEDGACSLDSPANHFPSKEAATNNFHRWLEEQIDDRMLYFNDLSRTFKRTIEPNKVAQEWGYGDVEQVARNTSDHQWGQFIQTLESLNAEVN